MECEYGSWKGMEMTKVIFPYKAKQGIPRTNDCFHIILNGRSWKTFKKVLEKENGKSWNFITSKEYKPSYYQG